MTVFCLLLIGFSVGEGLLGLQTGFWRSIKIPQLPYSKRATVVTVEWLSKQQEGHKESIEMNFFRF